MHGVSIVFKIEFNQVQQSIRSGYSGRQTSLMVREEFDETREIHGIFVRFE